MPSNELSNALTSKIGTSLSFLQTLVCDATQDFIDCYWIKLVRFQILNSSRSHWIKYLNCDVLQVAHHTLYTSSFVHVN